MLQNSEYKQREKLTKEKKDYLRLKAKKEDRPYHERNYGLYIILIVVGILANVVSGATESSKIFSFCFSFMEQFWFANTGAWIITIIFVIILEYLHRILAKGYFKNFVENNGHIGEMTGRMLATLLLGVFLTVLSFNGGFDLIRLTKSKPQKETPQQIEINDVVGVMEDLVYEAEQEADEYKNTRQWKGRLSTKDASEWKRLKEKKEQREDKLVDALIAVPSTNLQLQERADSLYTQNIFQYEEEVSSRGYGLGFVTIVAILILYGCLYFEERYEDEKADYLEQKFGATLTQKASPTLPVPNLVEDKLIRMEDLILKIAATTTESATDPFQDNKVATVTDSNNQKKTQ